MSLAEIAATREKYTVADILHMEAAGMFDPTDNFELVEGEIVPMNAKHHAHELVKSVLGMSLARACPAHLLVGYETSIFLSADTFLEPDLSVYPKSIRSDEVRGPDLVIAIEISDSTLAFDRGRKTRLYARHGVREYWVVDAVKRRTFIHLGPSVDGWASITEYSAEHELRLEALPGLALRLSEI